MRLRAVPKVEAALSAVGKLVGSYRQRIDKVSIKQLP